MLNKLLCPRLGRFWLNVRDIITAAIIRNLFEDCTWIDAQIASGAKLAIVGAGRDVDMVIERIRNPIRIAARRSS
jgi:hypothetical protein